MGIIYCRWIFYCNYYDLFLVEVIVNYKYKTIGNEKLNDFIKRSNY